MVSMEKSIALKRGFAHYRRGDMWRPAPRGTELAARPKPFGASIFDNWTKRRDAGATGHRTAPEPVLLSLEALRLLRSSRFALTQPDAFGAGESLGVLESGSKGECGLTQRRKGAEVLGSRYPPSEASRASGRQSGAKPQFLPSFSKPPRLPAAKATQTKNRKQKGNTET